MHRQDASAFSAPLLRRLGRAADLPGVHAHRFRHTFATGAIAHDARELDVQHLLGHSSPDMVRRYSATYGSAQATERPCPALAARRDARGAATGREAWSTTSM